MGAIEALFRRFGYAKLDRYGLVLTPEERVLSTRPAVLDDGLGGKIVGWVEGDLAAMELDRWGATKPAAAKPVAVTRSAQSPIVALPVSTKPVAPPPIPVRPVTAAVPVVAAPVPSPVAAQPPVEEDEWEWEIAMARARAVAADVNEAAAAIATHVSKPKADPMASWPATEPLAESWGEPTRDAPAPRVMSPLAKTIAADKRSPAKGTPVMPRSTVIPVPSLPVAAKPTDVRPPAYRPSSSVAQQPHRSRIARGTGGEDTVQTLAAPPPANDDHTSPYVTLPTEVKPVGYAHTRHVAAKHR